MNKNIRQSTLRFDAMLLAFIMLFVGSIGSNGGIITSGSAPISNISPSKTHSNQQHFSISLNQENIVLTEIEETEVEEEAKSFSPAYSSNIAKISTKNKGLIAQEDIYSSIPKPKKYILFQALKLDC
jgi:hypothetical protein